MFLSDVDIKKAIKKGDVILKPFRNDKLQPASYDISLGNKFIVNDAHTTSFIDPVNKVFKNQRSKCQRRRSFRAPSGN